MLYWAHMLTAPSLFGTTAQKGASDLHLLVGHKPILRVTGELVDLEGEDVLTDVSMEKITSSRPACWRD